MVSKSNCRCVTVKYFHKKLLSATTWVGTIISLCRNFCVFYDDTMYFWISAMQFKSRVLLHDSILKWNDVQLNWTNLQNHAPAEVKVSGGCQPRALMVHLNGQLLDLSFQPRRSVDRWHLADGHEWHSWLKDTKSELVTFFILTENVIIKRYFSIKKS